MATKEEYAQLSLYVYNIAVGGNDLNRPNLPSSDWVRLEYHPDDAIGFSYGVFKNNVTGEVVVAYTGTNEKKVADFVYANIPALVGDESWGQATKVGVRSCKITFNAIIPAWQDLYALN